jgi:hypothetical protein
VERRGRGEAVWRLLCEGVAHGRCAGPCFALIACATGTSEMHRAFPSNMCGAAGRRSDSNCLHSRLSCTVYRQFLRTTMKLRSCSLKGIIAVQSPSPPLTPVPQLNFFTDPF